MKRLRHLAIVMAAAALLGADRGHPKPGTAPDKNKPGSSASAQRTAMEGTWGVVDAKIGGLEPGAAQAKALKALKVSITRDTVRLHSGNDELSVSRYAIDPSKKPPVIDMWSEHKLTLGVYQLEDDKLRLHISESGRGRPANLSADSVAPGDILLVLRREPGKARPTTTGKKETKGPREKGPPPDRGRPLWLLRADGSGMRPFLSPPEYIATGSPRFSADGKKVAFDAWRSGKGETYALAHVFTAGADGTGLEDRGPGAMPSWSPDAKRIAFSQYSPYRGVWMMNADGSGRELIDADGWSARWSPVADQIAYTKYFDGADLCIYDVEKRRVRTLMEPGFRTIYWGFAWSPDGKWIGFKGAGADGKAVVATVSVEGQKKGFRVLTKDLAPGVAGSVKSSLGWGGDGGRLVVSMRMPGDRLAQLYFLNAKGAKPPVRVPGQAADRDNSDCAWCPGTTAILVASRAVKPPAGKK